MFFEGKSHVRAEGIPRPPSCAPTVGVLAPCMPSPWKCPGESDRGQHTLRTLRGPGEGGSRMDVWGTKSGFADLRSVELNQQYGKCGARVCVRVCVCVSHK